MMEILEKAPLVQKSVILLSTLHALVLFHYHCTLSRHPAPPHGHHTMPTLSFVIGMLGFHGCQMYLTPVYTPLTLLKRKRVLYWITAQRD